MQGLCHPDYDQFIADFSAFFVKAGLLHANEKSPIANFRLFCTRNHVLWPFAILRNKMAMEGGSNSPLLIEIQLSSRYIS